MTSRFEDDLSISDLRERPDLVPVVAERIWREWWQAEGSTLGEVEAMVEESLGDTGIPFALVAHRGNLFLGTASVVAADLKARPHYTPWIAAVFVEPGGRGRGIGSALVRAATAAAFRLPVTRLYLNATPSNAVFYDALGWTRIESDVGGLVIFARDRPSPSP